MHMVVCKHMNYAFMVDCLWYSLRFCSVLPLLCVILSMGYIDISLLVISSYLSLTLVFLLPFSHRSAQIVYVEIQIAFSIFIEVDF